MEAKQFDQVARAVGQGTARRQLLTGLLGAVLAGSLGRATGSAKGKRQHHQRQRARAQKVNENSQGGTRKPDGTPCKNGVPCQSGHCCGATQRKPGTCQACCVDTHCTAPQTCGGGGTANVCGCTPSCAPDRCDTGAPDGCGGTLDCPDCTTLNTICVANQCVACGTCGRVCCPGNSCLPLSNGNAIFCNTEEEEVPTCRCIARPPPPPICRPGFPCFPGD